MGSKILVGDCLTSLRSLEAQSVQTCVTSPPYFGLRDYGHPGQIGLEATPDAYVAKMVEVFREVRRVLRDDGTLWLNLGDSYASGGRKSRDPGQSKIHPAFVGDAYQDGLRPADPPGIKPKDLLGIPWRVAFALQADGWYLRQDIIWSKPNPMPESVRDRCTKAHEYIFMLSKSARYYYDADAIAEPLTCLRKRGSGPMVAAGTGRNDAATGTKGDYRDKQSGHGRRHAGFNARYFGSDKPYTGQSTKDFTAGGAQDASATKARIVDRILSGEITTRNKRSVWTVTTKPFKGAHFATFPPDLIEPCILAGCPVGGTVLDPFGGAGTTGMVAQRHGRNAILCELNPEYAAMAEARIAADAKKTLESLL
jgi:DNA modification methylase